jgi:hypothetical protein
LTHGLGSGEIGVQGRPECGRTGFEEGIGAEQQSLRSPLFITQPFGDPDDVAGQAEPFLGGARGSTAHRGVPPNPVLTPTGHHTDGEAVGARSGCSPLLRAACVNRGGAWSDNQA